MPLFVVVVVGALMVAGLVSTGREFGWRSSPMMSDLLLAGLIMLLLIGWAALA